MPDLIEKRTETFEELHQQLKLAQNHLLVLCKKLKLAGLVETI